MRTIREHSQTIVFPYIMKIWNLALITFLFALTNVQAQVEINHSLAPGFYSTGQLLELSVADSTGTIYFTIDGSMPDSNSARYTNPIPIQKTQTVKSVWISENGSPASYRTATFIIQQKKPYLPTVSLSTDSVNLFSDTLGIYVEGTNGALGYCNYFSKRNYCQDWERPANFEYFDENGIRRLSMNIGVKIHGNCSRNHPQKSLAIFARKKYGKGKLSYPLFDGIKDIKKFEAIILRNSGNDFNHSLIRDGLAATLVKNIDVDYQAYKPVNLYINGEYWGIMNMREKINEHFIWENHPDLDKGDLDYLDYRDVKEGDDDKLNALLDYLKTSNPKADSTLEYVKSQLDLVEYLNYNITEIYFANGDWRTNNYRLWRPKTTNGKWRWILTDLDYSFGFANQNYDHNTLLEATSSSQSDMHSPYSAFLLRKLLEIHEVQGMFIDLSLIYLETIFSADNVISTIDSLKKNLKDNIEAHAERWGMVPEEWDTEIENMKEFARKRPHYYNQFLIEYFGEEAVHIKGTMRTPIAENRAFRNL